MQASTAFFAALVAFQLPFPTTSTLYTLQDDYFATSPSDLFSRFTFETQDPTNGAVRYVSAAEAEASNLIGFVNSAPSSFSSQFRAFIGLGVPGVPSYGPSKYSTSTAAAASSSGIPSVRVQSKTAYEAGILLITSISHIPVGCGTWPALWLLGTGQQWPAAGEIDLVEQVNGLPGTRNSMTLHTGPGCTLTANATGTAYSGTLISRDCDVKDPAQSKNQGCQIQSVSDKSFGKGFNDAGGGVYALEWTAGGISIWFWEQGQVPAGAGAAKPDPSAFGMPAARFDGAGCKWDEAFRGLNVLVNTELCGEWAGSDDVWENSGCKASTGKATCKDFAEQGGGKGLEDAFWVLDGLKVFKA